MDPELEIYPEDRHPPNNNNNDDDDDHNYNNDDDHLNLNNGDDESSSSFASTSDNDDDNDNDHDNVNDEEQKYSTDHNYNNNNDYYSNNNYSRNDDNDNDDEVDSIVLEGEDEDDIEDDVSILTDDTAENTTVATLQTQTLINQLPIKTIYDNNHNHNHNYHIRSNSSKGKSKKHHHDTGNNSSKSKSKSKSFMQQPSPLYPQHHYETKNCSSLTKKGRKRIKNAFDESIIFNAIDGYHDIEKQDNNNNNNNNNNNKHHHEFHLDDDDDDDDESWPSIYLCFTAMLAAIGGVIYGYIWALNGLSLVQDSFIDNFCVGIYGTFEECNSLTTSEEPHDWIVFKTQFVGTILLGALIGSTFCGWAADVLGRRLVICLSAMTFMISVLILVSDVTLTWFLFGRLLMGAGKGSLSIILSVYLTEISPQKFRGRISGMLPLVVSFSLMFAVFTVIKCDELPKGWMYCYLITLIPGVIIVLGIWLCPESPRWSMQQNQNEEAMSSLIKLFGEEEASIEYEKILSMAEQQKHQKNKKKTKKGGPQQSEFLNHDNGENNTDSWKAFLYGSVRERLLACCTIQLFSQLSGFSAMITYVPVILKEMGFASKYAGTFTCYLMSFFGTVFAVTLIDSSGRKTLMLRGGIGMFVGCLGGGLTAMLGLHMYLPSSESIYLWRCFLFLGFLCSYFIFYSASFGAVNWILPAEIFPQHLRSKAVSLVTFVHFIAAYLASYSLELIYHIGVSGTLFSFGVVALLNVLYVGLRVPETGGKSLEEIDTMFDRRYRNELSDTKNDDNNYKPLKNVTNSKAVKRSCIKSTKVLSDESEVKPLMSVDI